MSPDVTASDYSNEPVKYPSLQVIDLPTEAQAVTEEYRNQVLNRVNDSCLRLAVFQGAYRWHVHPASDELFVVLEGAIIIELKDGPPFASAPFRPRRSPPGSSTARSVLAVP